MGNCQAAEAATVLIQHPGSKIERVCWSLSAQQVMASNPGFYVALLRTLPAPPEGSAEESELPARQLKLLRPNDVLVLGQVYRLVSFEDVLENIVTRKSMDTLLMETRGRDEGEGKRKTKRKKEAVGPNPYSPPESDDPVEDDQQVQLHQLESSPMAGGRHYQGGTGRLYGGGQWRPALQTIAEVGD